MKRMILIVLVFHLWGLFLSECQAKDFKWAAVTQAEWAVQEDSARGIEDAVYLFEKIESDERKLISEKCYYTIYRRLRILSPEGRSWGDITIPYVHKEQKIEKIAARTILPNGEIVPLPENQIYEKDILKSEGIKIKQKAFSLPRLTDDCIIEYYVKFFLPSAGDQWQFQKELHLLKGEYLWKFYRGYNLSGYIYDAIKDYYTPNYLLLNFVDKKMNVRQLPSLKDPHEVLFEIENIPPFTPEPFSQPDDVLKGQLRCYYGGTVPPRAFWGNLDKELRDGFKEFTKKNKRVREVVKQFSGMNDIPAKVGRAYQWLQQNIVNVTYEDDSENYKENKNVNDVIKHGYGTSSDINFTFYDMLREMGVDAKMAYTTDRDENILIYQVKYWQFDRSLVALPNNKGQYSFYNPGGKYLPEGSVAWFNEGTVSLVVGDMSQSFFDTPCSPAAKNDIRRYNELVLSEDLGISGKSLERCGGHVARTYRLNLIGSSRDSKSDYLSKKYQEQYKDCEFDSFKTRGLNDLSAKVAVVCDIKFNKALQPMGSRILIKPCDYMTQCENPFTAEERKYIIMFDYAKEITEGVRITMPEQWRIEAVPVDTTYENAIGRVGITFKKMNEGRMLAVQKTFSINIPMIKPVGYNLVKTLFEERQKYADMTVVLKKE
ncbi:MAG: DUF3857 domain-containing protein [candidate division KSB1 bacterium]|jgi:hypothetical protein|nr:DUF3857 domain-containing protein [candidate division KSB1 bacterium]